MSFNVSSFYNLVTSAILAISSPIIAEQRVSHVSKVESLCQIPTTQPEHTLFLFDIDDTIFDSPYMLGSKAWRRYIVEAVRKIDNSENWHDIFSYSLAQKYPLQLVEAETSEFVKELQNKGYAVCGFTSRERSFWYDMAQNGVDILTTEQLRSVNVDFNNKSLEKTYPYLSRDPEYFEGIFFANVEPKGNFLLNLLRNTPRLPSKVVFIDDKLTQVESVANTLETLKIPYECYTYIATDEKNNSFDPLIANIELYYFYKSNGKEIRGF